ncbi:MAG: cytochrome P450 [Gammaproteobacteria bacterium]|nr:cytochrome P450 [Gammaproteobacteria bacterium]
MQVGSQPINEVNQVPEPQYQPDFYSTAFIEDSMPHYKRMRDLGPAVWLPRHKVWAVCRYEDVKQALSNDEVLISGEGVAVNGFTNKLMTGDNTVTLTADGADHARRRRALGKPLSIKAVRELKNQIQDEADSLIDRLLVKSNFDGVADFAEHLPVHIVSNLLGIPEAGRKNMLNWSTQSFNTTGPYNWRTLKSVPAAFQMVKYGTKISRDSIDPKGWVNNLYDAADEGILGENEVPGMVLDYMAPSLDTTITASSHMVYLLGRHPDAWEELRADPDLISGVARESLRLASPIRGWCRYATQDVEVGGTIIPAHSRVLVVLASANHDERKWDDPEKFDIHRNPRDHVAFGFGSHSCLGRHLAQLEMESLLRAMAPRVSRIEAGEPRLAINNTLRGFASLPVKFN